MNLLELRQHFRKTSGNYSLVEEDGTDNGANFYINSGIRMLSRLCEHSKSPASHFSFINIGHFSTSFPYCRAIKEVWIATTSERWELNKKTFNEMTADYLTALPSERNRGLPAYYAPCITRYIPEDATADTFEAFAGFVDVPAGNAHEYNTIVISVPVSQKVMIEVRGFFYPMELIDDDDENYWTVVHPELVYMATMHEIEITNRNTQGTKDWLTSISEKIRQIEFDRVRQEISQISQMEG